MENNKQTQDLVVKLLLSALKSQQPMGRGTLALILKGSKDKLMFQRALDRSDFYGALFWYTIEMIEDFLCQLIEQQYIEVQYLGLYHVPVLHLTKSGDQALEKNMSIHIIERKKKVQLKMNESVEQTFHLFKECKSVPLVAQKRELVETTIWQHMITLVSLSYLSLDEVLEKSIQEQIFEAIEKAKDLRLKHIKEYCPNISYEEIRCLLAPLKLQNNHKL